jgi:hypothetical protein
MPGRRRTGIPIANGLGVGSRFGDHTIEIVRIVEDTEITSGTEDAGFDGTGDPVASTVVLKLAFLVLNLRKGESFGPPFLVPVGLDEPAAGARVTERKVFAERRAEEFFVRTSDPDPSGEVNGDQAGLIRARHNVDDEAPDLTAGESLEVIAETIDMPIVLESYSGVDSCPGIFEKGFERTLGFLGFGEDTV